MTDLTVFAGLCDGLKVVTDALNPFITILWTQIWRMSLKMLSVDQNLADVCKNLSMMEL